jgi:hypothetical protein
MRWKEDGGHLGKFQNILEILLIEYRRIKPKESTESIVNVASFRHLHYNLAN